MALALATSNAVPEMPGQDGFDRTGARDPKGRPRLRRDRLFRSLCKQSKRYLLLALKISEIRYGGTNATDIRCRANPLINSTRFSYRVWCWLDITLTVRLCFFDHLAHDASISWLYCIYWLLLDFFLRWLICAALLLVHFPVIKQFVTPTPITSFPSKFQPN